MWRSEEGDVRSCPHMVRAHACMQACMHACSPVVDECGAEDSADRFDEPGELPIPVRGSRQVAGSR